MYEIEAILEQGNGVEEAILVSWKGYGWHDKLGNQASRLQQDVPVRC